MAQSLHLVEPQGQLSTNTIITITGTADCSLLGVVCYEDSGTTLTQIESGHDGTGSISATYTVKEGSVEIFCDGTCEDTDEYIRSNVITITSEGELVVIFGQYTVYSIQLCGACAIHQLLHKRYALWWAGLIKQVKLLCFSLKLRTKLEFHTNERVKR